MPKENPAALYAQFMELGMPRLRASSVEKGTVSKAASLMSYR